MQTATSRSPILSSPLFSLFSSCLCLSLYLFLLLLSSLSYLFLLSSFSPPTLLTLPSFLSVFSLRLQNITVIWYPTFKPRSTHFKFCGYLRPHALVVSGEWCSKSSRGDVSGVLTSEWKVRNKQQFAVAVCLAAYLAKLTILGFNIKRHINSFIENEISNLVITIICGNLLGARLNFIAFIQSRIAFNMSCTCWLLLDSAVSCSDFPVIETILTLTLVLNIVLYCIVFKYLYSAPQQP